MHELSIAQSILDIVHEAVPDPGNRALLRVVKVRVGKLSGVMPEALEFCFDALVAGTPLVGAKLAIEHVPIRLECRDCGVASTVEDLTLACPVCGGGARITAGTELAVAELELAEVVP
jgi:hydrogenase nickel incorporation protein HypA/HybF